MKIKVTRKFIDRANNMTTRERGEIYEAPDERGNFLIQLGLAEKIEEPEPEAAAEAEKAEAVEAPQKEGEAEAVEAPQNEGKGEAEEVPAEPKKTAKRGKKAAE